MLELWVEILLQAQLSDIICFVVKPKLDKSIDEVILHGFEFKLKTIPGVFSSTGIDNGTKLLIDNLNIQDETVVADLGSGNGVVGFVAAKLNPRGHVHLLDDSLRATELARDNVELNKLDRNVEVYLSDLFSAVSTRTYHQIYSNPPQQLGNDFLEELINESFQHLKLGGELYLVVKSNLKAVFERMLKKTFKNSQIIAQNREYVIWTSRKTN